MHEHHELFVSFAEEDGTWVHGELLESLRLAGVDYVTDEEFRLGAYWTDEAERQIKNSDRVLLVMSHSHLASVEQSFIERLSRYHALTREKATVIPLLLEDVPLRLGLEALVRIQAFTEVEREAALRQLCEFLNHAPIASPPMKCPYPGPTPFTTDDTGVFFGRSTEIDQLLQNIRKDRFLAILGPSGWGKSSLVFAGLVPALLRDASDRGEIWSIIEMRPGESPVDTFQSKVSTVLEPPRSIADLPGRVTVTRMLLVIDQFDELFACERGNPQVTRFQELLLQWLKVDGFSLVITVRPDSSYQELVTCQLWPLIQAHRYELGILGTDQLREAIVRPARKMGVLVEPGLVDRLLHDAAGQPGALPSLQAALVQLWRRMPRKRLALDKYLGMGRDGRNGLQEALSSQADDAFNMLPDDCHRAIGRRIVLRLVHFGEGRSDTRRQQRRSQLISHGDDVESVDRTLKLLAEQRLLVIGQQLHTHNEDDRRDPPIDIAHDWLITGWRQLQCWLQDGRRGEVTRRRYEDRAVEWISLGGAFGGLLDEVQLSAFHTWRADKHFGGLGESDQLHSLVAASERAIEVQQRQHKSRLRHVRVSVTSALVILAALSAIAIFEWRSEHVANDALIKANESLDEFSKVIANTLRDKEAALLRAEQATIKATRNEVIAQENEKIARGYSADILQIVKTIILDLQRGYSEVAGGRRVRQRLVKTGLDSLNGMSQRFVDIKTLDRETAMACAELGDLLLQFAASIDATAGGIDTSGATAIARKLFEKAFGITSELLKLDQHNPELLGDLAVYCDNLGKISFKERKIKEATEHYQQEFEIRERLASLDPESPRRKLDVATAHDRLGNLQFFDRQFIDSKKTFTDALNIRVAVKDAVRDDEAVDSAIAVSYYKLGDVEIALGQLEPALKYYKAGFNINQKLADRGNRTARRMLGVGYEKLGNVFFTIETFGDAKEWYDKNLTVRRELADEEPEDSELQRDLALALAKSGDVLRKTDKDGEALDLYKASLTIREHLTNSDRGNIQWLQDLSNLYERLVDVTRALKKLGEATEYCERCLQIRQKLLDFDPANPQARADLAQAVERWADVLMDMKRPADAITEVNRALTFRRDLWAERPNDFEMPYGIAVCQYRLGFCRKEMSEFETAIKELEAGIGIVDEMIANKRLIVKCTRVKKLCVDEIDWCREAILATGALNELVAHEDRTYLPTRLWLRTTLCVKVGKMADALLAAEELKKYKPASANSWFHAAKAYAAYAAALAVADATEEKLRESRQHAETALECLRELSKTGFKDGNAIRNDPGFEGISKMPEFESLIREIEMGNGK